MYRVDGFIDDAMAAAGLEVLGRESPRLRLLVRLGIGIIPANQGSWDLELVAGQFD
jgi:hypothetical protein